MSLSIGVSARREAARAGCGGRSGGRERTACKIREVLDSRCLQEPGESGFELEGQVGLEMMLCPLGEGEEDISSPTIDRNDPI